MHEGKIPALVRGGMSVALVGTLMVPSTAALAKDDDAASDAPASVAASDADADASSDADAAAAGASGESGDALPAIDEEQRSDELAKLKEQAGESDADATTVTDAGAAGSQDAVEGDAAAAADGAGDTGLSLSAGGGLTTIIVQLEDGGNQGVSLFSTLRGTASQDRHSYFKDRIRELAAEASADASDDTDASADADAANEGISLLSLTPDAKAASSSSEDIQELHDYYHVIDGFAVKAPASILDDIRAMDGVKNAFVETVHAAPVDQGSTALAADSALKNQNALDATEADQVAQKGDGRTVAIIDTGLDTDHEAFSGDLDDAQVALTSSDAGALAGKVGHGAYVSEKIPYAYDYADGDNDVNPGGTGMEHGTHVAGIAAANGGDQIRGTAPNAQIVGMKVATDNGGGMPDSAILAALDDCVVINPTSVNISLGSDAGFSDEGDATFSDAISKLEDAGVTVNVAAGNSYTSAYNNKSGQSLPYADDPDSSVISSPAASSSSFAVASVNADATPVQTGGDEQQHYLTAADGSKIAYTELTAPDGSPASAKFSDVADGTYEYVWGGIGRADDNDTSTGSTSGIVDENGDVQNGEDLTGKIVVVEGHAEWIYGIVIEYARAANYYKGLGAAGVIFYDSAWDGKSSVAFDDGGYYGSGVCPAVMVSQADGMKLREAAEKKVTVAQGGGEQAALGDSITAADGTKMPYTELTAPDGSPASAKFSDVADGTYEYVWGGIGRDDDNDTSTGSTSGIVDENGDVQNGEDLTGKIVVVEGHAEWIYGIVIGYDRAANYYKSMGAAGVIFYDSAWDGTSPAAFDDTGYYSSGVCPAIMVSAEDGMKLREAAEKKVTVSHDASGDQPNTMSVYQVNTWSSWGVTPDLKLKPEIAAPGGNVYSSIPNGGYAYYSGTSMATPQMTGIAALMHEYVDSDAKFASMGDADKTAVVTQLLMSTATPQADAKDTSSYYSPRHQGAGLANVKDAMASDVYATVDGAENASRPKADLGESGSGSWTFTVTLHNLGSAEHTYSFDPAALSDTVADGYFQLQSKNWTGQGIDVTSSAGDAVTVPANGTAQVTVTVAAGDAFTSWAAANTPKGTFVDGYAMFKATDGGVDLSVPFMGFYGDWSDASVFDAAVDESPHAFGTKLVDASSGDYLGVNPLDDEAARDESKIDMSKVVLSQSGFSGAPTSATVYTGLLRNVDSLSYELTVDGETASEPVAYSYVPKTTYNVTTGTWRYAESTSAFANGAPVLNGSSGVSTVGLKEMATTSGPTPETQSQTFDIHYDNEGPTITKTVYSDNNGSPTLTFTVEDDTYLAAIDFVDPQLTGVTPYSKFYRVLVDPDTALVETKDDGTHVYQVTVNVSDVKGAWNGEGDIPNVVAAYAWDYGMNPSGRTNATVTPVAATGVAIDGDAPDIAPGEQRQLSATLTPADTTETDLVWSSSDESVATVDADGMLHGVSEGTATVSVQVEGRPELVATKQVTVAKVASDEGIRLSAPEMRVEKHGTAEVSALLSEDLAGKTVTWSTSDANVVSVEADADDSSKATLSGAYQVADATITASVTDDAGVVHTATMQAKNRPADYDDFVIKDGVLTKYVGVKSSVQIPNDVTEIADGLFEGDASVSAVAIPASVERIGKRAFSKKTWTQDNVWYSQGTTKTLTFEDTAEHPSKLTTIDDGAFAGVGGDVVMPDSVTTIGTGLFDGNLSVTTVRLSDNVTEIPDNTFNKAASLTHVDMSDKVTRIGTSAFKSCLYLQSIGIIGKEAQDGVIPLPSALTELGDSALAAGYLGGWVDADGVTRGSVVDIPAGVKRIESSAFALNSYLVGVTLNEGLESIGQNAFQQTNVPELTLPDSLTSLDYHALFGMTNLQELTLGKNLGEGELAGAIGSYKNNMMPAGMQIMQVNVPDDAVNYRKAGDAVTSKDGTVLEYYPAGLTGYYEAPEGIERIAQGAFDDTHLTSLGLPDSLQTVDASGIAAQFDTLDFGSHIKSIAENAFKQEFYADDSANEGYTPAHLVVRGGDGGSYADTQAAQNQQTAYFGPGMTTLAFAKSGAPAILVVPADLASLDLSGNAGNPAAVTVYAPEGSDGWNVASAALTAIGADPATQLKPYTTFAAKVAKTSEADGTISYEASSEGGVGGVWYRFVQVNADGTETVLQDWGPDATYDWQKPAEGGSLRAEVRDTTELTASAMAYGPAAPVFVKDLAAETLNYGLGETADALTVEAASEGAELSYQWYRDGEAIEGATEAAYTPSTSEPSTHAYTCVVTATKDGQSVSTTSAQTVVMVGMAAAMPTFAQDLASSANVQAAGDLTLSVAATTTDAGTISYQWYRDGAAIEGATGASYAVDTTEVGTHAYAVRATNTLTYEGVTTSAVATSTTCSVTVEEVPVPAGDATALSTYVNRVKDLKEDAYTPETWKAFSEALTNAQSVLANAGALQTELNAALSQLQLGYEGLAGVAHEVTKIPDGTYSVTVTAYNALHYGELSESMAGALFNKDATLTVKDGVAYVQLALNQHMGVMGSEATLSNLYYYPDGYTGVTGGAYAGVGTPAQVTVDESDAEGLPTKVSFPLNDQALTEGMTLLSGAFGSMGDQNILIGVDWAKFSQDTGIATTQAADKTALSAAIDAAAALTPAGVEGGVLTQAVTAAQEARDNAYASQASVDAATIDLLQAVDRVQDAAAFPFLAGGTYRMPVSLVDAAGAPVTSGFTMDATATKGADGYDVTLQVMLEAGLSVEKLTYGADGAVAEEVADADAKARMDARADDATVQTFKLHVASLDEPLPVTFDVKANEKPSQVTGYALFDTSAVQLVDESAVVLVDKTALTSGIEAAAAVQQGQKSDEAWAALQAAIADARAVANDADATQTEVAVAAKELAQAVDAFNASADVEPPAAVDKAALTEVIGKAAAVQQGQKSDEAWATLQAAIADAQAVADDADATQADVDAAVAALTQAVDAFNASADVEPGENPDPNEPGENPTPNPNPGENPGGSDNGNGSGDNGSNQQGGSSNGNGAGQQGGSSQQGGSGSTGATPLAQTDDGVPVAPVAATGLFAGAVAAIAAFFSRRKREE